MNAAAGLEVSARVVRGAFTLDVALTAEPGEVIAILGPNGSGKSTLLSVIAGLTIPQQGRVVVSGRTLTGDGAAVPPAQRRIGLMGQDPLLFPHLSAVENIAFGPRSQGEPRAAAREQASQWLARLGLAEFADRRPARLSGGQRQRVALARALAARPDLLLLDEPLGALDAQTAPEIRQVLRTHLRAGSLTTLLVTHDVLDAATLADRVIVLVDGSLVDSGPTVQVLAAPKSAFAAALAGLNMVPGTIAAPAEAGELATLQAGSATFRGAAPRGAAFQGIASQGAASQGAASQGIAFQGIAAEPLAAGATAMAVFPPSAVAVYLDHPGPGSPRNTWPAAITALEPGPSAIRVRAQLGDAAAGISVAADLTPAAVAELALQPGSPVQLAVKATEVRVHAR